MTHPASLALARSLQWFDGSAAVLSLSQVRQPGGRTVDTWTPTGEVIPARLSPVSSSEPLVLGRPSIRARFYLVLPWDKDVANEARVTFTHETGWQRTLAVVGRHSPRSNQIVTKLVVEEVA